MAEPIIIDDIGTVVGFNPSLSVHDPDNNNPTGHTLNLLGLVRGTVTLKADTIKLTVTTDTGGKVEFGGSSHLLLDSFVIEAGVGWFQGLYDDIGKLLHLRSSEGMELAHVEVEPKGYLYHIPERAKIKQATVWYDQDKTMTFGRVSMTLEYT